MPALTNTQVVAEWVKTLPGVIPTLVGPTLPREPSVWSDQAFWQVVLVGGDPHRDLPLKEPVVEINVWTASPEGATAPYNRAESLCMDVRNRAFAARSRHITIAGQDVFLLGILCTAEPRRYPEPRTNFARVALTVQAYWSEVAA